MPKFVNDKWGDDKYYYVAHNGIGGYSIKEFVNRCPKTELRVTREEKDNFMKMLKEQGWYEHVRN
jgi:hypothetical protein